MEYKDKNKNYKPPVYCRQCGEKLVISKKEGRFDPFTGKAIVRESRFCPTKDIDAFLKKSGLDKKSYNDLTKEDRESLENFWASNRGHTEAHFSYYI
jgi:hypothetical protein